MGYFVNSAHLLSKSRQKSQSALLKNNFYKSICNVRVKCEWRNNGGGETAVAMVCVCKKMEEKIGDDNKAMGERQGKEKNQK